MTVYYKISYDENNNCTAILSSKLPVLILFCQLLSFKKCALEGIRNIMIFVSDHLIALFSLFYCTSHP